MADRSRDDAPHRLVGEVLRADALLREVIAILDAEDFDRAAAYADMAREALIEALQA